MRPPITTQQPDESDNDWNKRETNALNYFNLSARLLEESDMIGWLCTNHRNKVHYPNVKPAIIKKIQQQLDKASDLIAITYIWALLEEGGFKESTKWISEDERLEMTAWKHVRHTGAHAPGSRAHGYSKDFDQYMISNSAALSALRENCEPTPDTINLQSGMSHNFFTFAKGMVTKALGFSANNNTP